MELTFVTTNKHKVDEANECLKEFGINVIQHDLEYEENHDSCICSIAKNAAKKLSEKLNKTVCVDDTGIFFDAYLNFPGALPKFVYNSLGYKGIMKLLENETRGACFKCVVAYCEPNSEPVLFEGVLEGNISKEIHDKEKNVLPYNRIFIPNGEENSLSKISLESKKNFSHRSKAFKKLGQYLHNKKN